MFVHEKYDGLNFVKPVITLGVFDGVHRGHKALLEYVVHVARLTGGESVAVTFNPHPRLVLGGDTGGLSFLSTLGEKESLIRETGIDHLIVIPFTWDISNLSAFEFIKQILVGKLGVYHLVVGYDHHFGRGRKGDFATVFECGKEFGFTVEKVEEVSAPEGTISSTAIREALLAGRLEEANNWLGYSYMVSGRVVKGKGIGRGLGFPTANIEPSDSFKLLPADGVYAVEVLHEESLLKGILNIGTNPTVSPYSRMRSVEVNILDFDGDLYDRELTVVFRYRLRDEIRFSTIAELVAQMELDRQKAAGLL